MESLLLNLRTSTPVYHIHGNFHLLIFSAISAKKLIPNYFYGAVIASNIKVPALEHEFTLPYPIVLKEGGYGGF